jgi:hypothetical protein
LQTDKILKSFGQNHNHTNTTTTSSSISTAATIAVTVTTATIKNDPAGDGAVMSTKRRHFHRRGSAGDHAVTP